MVQVAKKPNPSPIPRLVGVEIEVAQFDTGQVFQSFRDWFKHEGGDIVTDGSLPSTGREFVTPPWAGEVFKTKMKEVSTRLREMNAEVTTSCGLHNHVDARDFTAYDVRRMIMLWARIEPLIMTFAPEARQSYDTCKYYGLRKIANILADYRSPALTRLLLYGMMYGEPAGRKYKTHKYCSSRYHSLNVHSWNLRRTFEFRVPPGTVAYQTIVHWASLFSQIVEFAYRSKEKDLAPVPMYNRENTVEFVKKFVDQTTMKHFLGRR